MHPATTTRLTATALLLAPTLASCALISPAAEPAPPALESSTTSAPAQTTPSAPTPSSVPVKTFDPQAPQPFIIKDRQPPVLSDVARQPDGEGAEAYAYFILDAWVYALATNDIEWFSANLVGESKTLQRYKERLVENAESQYVIEMSTSNVRVTAHKVNPENENEHAVELELETGPIDKAFPNQTRTRDREAARYKMTTIIRPGDTTPWTVGALSIEKVTQQ